MIFSFLYEIGLHLLALLYFPIFLYHLIFKKKYRKSFFLRFGKGFPKLKGTVFWVHAVSVGEVKAVATLVRLIKQNVKDAQIIITTITETGFMEAQRSLPEDYHYFLPYDFFYIIKRVMKKVSPRYIILSETDFWYNFLKYSKNLGAKLILVNGKISDRSLKRYALSKSITQAFFSRFDLICAQDEDYRIKFLQLGIDPAKIFVTGNLKLDDEYTQLAPEEVALWKKKLHIHDKELVLVIGSTHDPEEQIFLSILKKLWDQFPELKVLLVPRHPERFNEVANLIEKIHISYSLYSELSTHKNGEEDRLILVDAMGVLKQLYQLSDVSLVAGSFVHRVGGHNILEPSGYAKPVVFGPFMHTQKAFLELSKKYQAGIQVEEKDLLDTLVSLFKDKDKRDKMGKNGQRIFIEASGASKRTFTALSKILQ